MKHEKSGGREDFKQTNKVIQTDLEEKSVRSVQVCNLHTDSLIIMILIIITVVVGTLESVYIIITDRNQSYIIKTQVIIMHNVIKHIWVI